MMASCFVAGGTVVFAMISEGNKQRHEQTVEAMGWILKLRLDQANHQNPFLYEG